MKIILGSLFLLVLISCSTGIIYQERPSINKLKIEPLPCWVYELPPGTNYVIGISAKTFDRESMLDSARQMAAVMKSRNKGSFTIDKLAITSGSEFHKEGNSRFKLNVAQPEETLNIYNSLQLVDETFLYDHYLALFSVTDVIPPESYYQKKIANFPEWYKRDEIEIGKDHVISYAKGSSYNLVNAWEKTAEKARYELAKYLEKNVQSIVLSKDENIEKKIALESAKKLVDLEISRSFIILKNFDSLISYQVYMELKMRK